MTPCETCDDAIDIGKINKERTASNKLVFSLEDKNLNTEQKKKIIEQIHKNIVKQPVGCNECHNKKSLFIIPLLKAGYPKERVARVASDQITKMIEQYEVFHTPKFLEPERPLLK